MGRILSLTTIYGVRIPGVDDNSYGEDFFNFSEPFWTPFKDFPEDAFLSDDTDIWDIESALQQRFPSLSIEISYIDDYVGGAILGIDATRSSAYGVDPFEITIHYLDAGVEELQEACILTGIPFEPQWWGLLSYG